MKLVSANVDQLVKEFNENIDEKKLHPNKVICNSTLNDYEKYVVLVNAVLAQYT